MNVFQELIAKIEAYAEKHEIVPSRVTRLALNDSSFYTRLKAGTANPQMPTLIRLYDFLMDETVDPTFATRGRPIVEHARIRIEDLPPIPREPQPVINDTNFIEGSEKLLTRLQAMFMRIAAERSTTIEGAIAACNYSLGQRRKMGL